MLAAELLGSLLDHLASGSLTALVMRRNLASLWYAVEVHQVLGAADRGKAVESFRRYAVAVELGRSDLAVAPMRELRNLGVIVTVQEPKQPAGPLGHYRSPWVREGSQAGNSGQSGKNFSPAAGMRVAAAGKHRAAGEFAPLCTISTNSPAAVRSGRERIERYAAPLPKSKTGPERFAPTPDPFVSRTGSYPNVTPGRNRTHTPSAPGA